MLIQVFIIFKIDYIFEWYLNHSVKSDYDLRWHDIYFYENVFNQSLALTIFC
jgi:hypothetical protein